MPLSTKNLPPKYFDFISTTAGLCMARVISKYSLYMDIFSIGRHYLSQSDVEVDISSTYSPKK